MKANLGTSNSKKFEFPLKNLKKHLFAFGGSGSGKTVFSKVVIEEAALNGVPSILIDPQGDLASLILPGNEESLEKHKLSKTKLEQYKEKIAIEIFTPISSKGIPICINPLNFDFESNEPEEIIPLINEIAISIAKLLGYSITNDKGKSSAAVLYTILKHYYDKKENIHTFKELANLVANYHAEPFAEDIAQLINSKKDIDELVRKIKFLTVGQKELMFNFGVPIDIDLLYGKKRKDGKTQISVIYLNTLANEEEKEFFLTIIANNLYQWMLSNPSEDLQGIFYMDEVSPYIPAGSEKPMPKPILMLLFKQARKYGLGLMIATQNPGDIDYKAFSQFGTWAMGRLTTKQDQKKVGSAFKNISSKNIEEKLPTLKPGNFILFSPDASKNLIDLKVRWLYTEHKTLTDVQIKKHITAEQRKYYQPLEVQNSKQKQPEQNELTNNDPNSINVSNVKKGIKKEHFENKLTEVELHKIINKNIKKSLLVIPQERIIDYKLTYNPIYKLNVSKKVHRITKKETKDFTVLINSITGEFMRQITLNSKHTTEFEKLIPLNETELKILTEIHSKKTTTTEAEIELKTKIKKPTITKALAALEKKHLISFQKEGKHKLWFSILPDDRVTLNLNDYNSHIPNLNNSVLDAPEENTKIPLKEIKKFVPIWFNKGQITDSSLIYLPIYQIELMHIKTKQTRKIRINGFTKRVI